MNNKIIIEGMKAKIPKGWGYWELNKYPWGGSFHRTPVDLELPIKEIFENFKDGTPRRFSVDFNGIIMGFNA